MQFFHVCPPVLNPGYDPILSPNVPQYIPRPQGRDENIVEEMTPGGFMIMEKDPGKPEQWRSKTKIKAEGSGRLAI